MPEARSRPSNSFCDEPEARLLAPEGAPHSYTVGAGDTLTVRWPVSGDYEIHLHSARIRDLLDRAAQHGVDTRDWVDPALLENSGLGH